jgi:starch phosphorylase
MQPIRTFEVIPFLPPQLDCLKELAFNLRWTWDHETIHLFQRLDHELWESTGHNPVLMLGTISQQRLDEAAKDEGFLAHLDRICQRHYEYLKNQGTWYKKQQRQKEKDVIAYFSAEFGLTECLPIYSGGLGILAGDHVKAASELGLPLVGVGIAYQQGYFRQYLNAEGWQQERYPINDFYNMPIKLMRNADGTPLIVTVDLPGRPVNIQVWKAQVGRVELYLMDTNIPQRRKEDEDITDALYHGDPDTRIQQEIILGIGGMRVLKALGISPTVCHMNEGHSAFLSIERTRQLMEDRKMSFWEAKEACAAGCIFTTHTAVPAGLDKFSPDLMDKYFSDYYRSLGISREEFLALGRANPSDNFEPFSMAHLAIRLSTLTNAVSKLHGEVSQKLFQGLWKDLPWTEVPINWVTNGIHTRSWISDEMADIYERYLGARWFEESMDAAMWKRIEEVPDEEMWRVRTRRRERLVNFCRKRMRAQLEARGALSSEVKEASEMLNPNALTIGFARRVATYKRATLLFQDAKRLATILNNKERPVQIIIAGKAHPEDAPAKALIREIIQMTRSEDLKGKIVFIEDYEINVARWLVSGVDVWLNTPRRNLEACGTSGMKVVFNGGLNCSILDGWWDEAYAAHPHSGWAIGRGEVYADQDYQDEVESNALYDLLEKEIVAKFYERDREGIPRWWIERVKNSMADLCSEFNVNRMVREYAMTTYFPATGRFTRFLESDAKRAKAMSTWKKKTESEWRNVHIERVETQIPETVRVGDDMVVRAMLHLGGLSPEDVAVQIYHGQIDAYNNIVDGEVTCMKPAEQVDGRQVFTGEIKYSRSGRHGFSVRVLPKHADLTSPYEMGLIEWASSGQLSETPRIMQSV